jgi:hypothetical protein
MVSTMIFLGGKILPLGDKTKPSNVGAVWHFFFDKNPLSPYLDNRFQLIAKI